jgi:hypothetical protein
MKKESKINLQVRKSQAYKRRCKGQIETMGLLVIVILISLILFFVLSFSLKNKTTEGQTDKQEFKQTQSVSNFGTTMLETTSGCKRTIRELLTDCAYTHEITCDGLNSCESANQTITQILDLTLNKWGYDYNMTVQTSQGVNVLSVATGCEVSKSSSKEMTPFGTNYGSMTITIKTCN